MMRKPFFRPAISLMRAAAILSMALMASGCATGYVSGKYKYGPPDRATALHVDSVTQARRSSKTLKICVVIIPNAPGGTTERTLYLHTESDALSQSDRPPVVMADNRAVPLYLLPPEDIGGKRYQRSSDKCEPLYAMRPPRLPIVIIEPGVSGVQLSEERFLLHVAARIQESEHETALFTARGPNGRLRLFLLAEKPIVAGSRILEIEPATGRRTGSIGWLAAVPFAIAVDIVTAPVQLAALVYFVATFRLFY